MSSYKTEVIRQLFYERYDKATRTISEDLVSLGQVSEAIAKWGDGASTKNPANFMKDIVRSPNRNNLFPEDVAETGWTARQEMGTTTDRTGGCFRFVPLPSGQTTAFLNNEPDPSMLQNPHAIQSLSLNTMSRRFGRPHETWLTHVATTLGVIHTHLALYGSQELIGLELLQTNIALGDGEVDALLLGTLKDSSAVLVSCEMKGPREVLDEDQIERGAKLVADSDPTIPVIPVGVKALKGGHIWVVEFNSGFPPLAKLSEGVYKLTPPVPGVGE